MGDLTLLRSAIREGRWLGEVRSGTGDALPEIEVSHLERPLDGLEVMPIEAGRWQVTVAIPPALLSEGVQSFLVRDRRQGVTIGHFTIVTGVALEDDIRAEIDLLRAEIDMLKRAFRRHCLETGG